jgi:hypothetical protein
VTGDRKSNGRGRSKSQMSGVRKVLGKAQKSEQ